MSEHQLPTPPSSPEAPPEQVQSRVRLALTVGAIGVLLFLAGMGLVIFKGELLNWYVPPLLILGPVTIIAVLIWNRGQEQRSVFVRRALYGVNIFLAVALLGATLGLANLLLAQYGPSHFDWTSEGAFSLSSQTKNLLAGLEKPVQFYVLYQRGSLHHQLIERTLDLYRAASDKVNVEYVDPYQDQMRVTELYNRFPDAKTGEPVVVVTFGEGERPEYQVVARDDIFRRFGRPVSPFEVEPEKTEFRAEDAFSSAINQLLEARQTTVYFTTGHGERALDNSDERDRTGIGRLKERLEGLNIQVQSINLMEKEVPKDCDILVVAGPQTPFFEAEIPKLRDFMAAGGRMIVLLDPGLEMTDRGRRGTGLENFLADYQVVVGDDLVIETLLAYRGVGVFLAQVLGVESQNPIVKGLVNQQVLFSLARRIEPKTASSPTGMESSENRYQAERLISTTPVPYAWAEANYHNTSEPMQPGGPGDTDGPVSLAVAVSEHQKDQASPVPGHPPVGETESVGRLVVVGDADFIANPDFELAANYSLFLNALNWLRGRMELLGIPPKEKKALQLTVDSQTFNRMIILPIAGVCGVIILAGITVWMVRRQV